MLAVYRLFRGMEAADAGQPITVCPYVDGTHDTTSFFAAHWWRRGWKKAAFTQTVGDTEVQ